MNITEKLLRQKQDFDDVYNIGLAKGKTDANNFFWDNYQLYGSRKSYSYAFFGNGWHDSTYYPQYDIYAEPKTDRARYMFAWSGIVDTKVPIEINGGTNSSGLPVVEEGIFLGCKRLMTIKELYINNYNATYNRWFEGCVNLTNITIKGQIKNNGFDIHWSTELSADSLKSIIDALSSDRTGLTITLPTTAHVNYDSVYGPGNFNSLLDTKPNWTIAYA